jgi:outer membrane murein-binding lipoprotein Lpp
MKRTLASRRRWATPAQFGAAAVVLAALLLSGCGSDVDRRAQTARPAEATHQDFGDFEVHYNAVRTDELTPDVARAYGIERSGNRVLLNVSLLAKAADGRTTPADGMVTATAYNLNGQLKSLEMRRVQEGSSVYFIGEVGISGTEILVFDISAQPRGGGAYSIQFKREFFAG